MRIEDMNNEQRSKVFLEIINKHWRFFKGSLLDIPLSTNDFGKMIDCVLDFENEFSVMPRAERKFAEQLGGLMMVYINDRAKEMRDEKRSR